MVKSNKKILFIVTQSEWGGAQRYIFDLATNLDRQRYTISVAAGLEGKELFNRLRKTNARTHQLKYLQRAINPYYDLRAIFEIAKLIKKECPNIIHLNSTKAGILGSLATLLIPKKLKAISYKLIYTAHGWVFNEPMSWWRKNLYLWLEKFTAKFKDKIICVSEYDKQVALKYKIAPKEKLTTIHNGIDLEKLEFLTKGEAINSLISNLKSQISNLQLKTQNYKIIGTIANLYPTKGLKYLIKAARVICNLKPKTYNPLFIIIGNGPEYKNIESRIKNYELNDKILLLGLIPDAHKYLKAFDIFILPSIKEGFPYVVLETMSAGLPIVATKTGGIPEIIKNDANGLLTPIKNSKALAKKIDFILNNNELSKKFSKNNLKDIKKFSLKSMIKKTEKEYNL